MPLISEDTIQEIQRSADIYEVVTGYQIPLKRAGANYKGLCPFHDEKTPSFTVHPERQIFKCFGCGKGGTATSFVMAMENVDFPEAIRILAEKTGITVKFKDGGQEGPDRLEVYRVLDWAGKHYRRLLTANPQAEKARAYAKKRGLTAEAIERWGVGYSLDSWNDVANNAKKHGFSDKLLLAAGLVKEHETGRIYDRFRGRLMFPVKDVRGRVVGFGGRAMGDAEPKYLNSPETAAFSKSRLLYGLDLAKDNLPDKTLYISEGYFDVVLPDQAGIFGLVATLGTALTKDHLRLIRRYATKVVLVFDADEAGRRAAERGLDLLLGENLDLFVARMVGGKDPADLVVDEGPDRLRELLSQPVEIFRFLVESLEAKVGGDTPAARTRVIEEMTERIAQVPNDIKREVLINQLCARYKMPEDTVRSEVRRRAGGGKRIAAPAPKKENKSDDRIGRELIELMLSGTDVLTKVVESVTPEDFPTDITRRIAEKIFMLFRKNGEVHAADLTSLMQDEESNKAVADILARVDDSQAELDKRVSGCLEYLSSRDYQRRARDLKAGVRNDQEADECARRLQKERGMRNPRAVPRG